MTICVFTGPSLSAKEARGILDAEYLPPVAQGDVYNAALKQPKAIAIIDGYFTNVPSVWHKEILFALWRGVHVFGGASMGALRAAELVPFGMQGVGWVFEAYRDGAIIDDDEVAVLHGPEEVGFPSLSEAMVNVRRTVAAAVAAQVVGETTGAALLDRAKALHFTKRTYDNIVEAAADLPATEFGAEVAAFADWLPQGRVDQKRIDAIALLRLLHDRHDALQTPNAARFNFEHTTLWEELTRRAARRAEA